MKDKIFTMKLEMMRLFVYDDLSLQMLYTIIIGSLLAYYVNPIQYTCTHNVHHSNTKLY